MRSCHQHSSTPLQRRGEHVASLLTVAGNYGPKRAIYGALPIHHQFKAAICFVRKPSSLPRRNRAETTRALLGVALSTSARGLSL